MDLYTVTHNGRDYLFTSANEDLEISGTTYKAIPISRTEIVYDLEHSSCKITAPVGIMPFSQLVDITPIKPFEVKIKSYPENITMYEGILQKVTVDLFSGKINIELITKISLQDNVLPRRTFGKSCSWELGGDECGVNLDLFKETLPIDTVNINGLQLTHPNFATHPDGWFDSGVAVTDLDEFVFIVKHIGDTITIMTRFQQISEANELRVFAGCDKQASTCKDKFNNICNFSGFPYIPTNNPALEDY